MDWMVPVGSLLFAALLVFLQRFSLRRAMKEVAEELTEKLQTDTNTRISVSSGDRGVRTLAAQINEQLQTLREERLKLQHGDAELKAAVTNISHDLRTPLTAISGYLDLLEQEPLSDKGGRYLAIIRERTDAMCRLTEELFQYSMMNGAAENLHTETVSLNDILEQSLAGFYGIFSERGMTPDIQMPEEKTLRQLDRAALRRIFDNILSNAAKYSDGDLRVRLTSDGTVTFENSAGDLSCVQTERLFDRFFTVKTAGGSTGLGLSIAKRLTEKMGGGMAAEYQAGRLKIYVRFPKGK